MVVTARGWADERKSYTVTVTRAGSPQTRRLSLLSLSGVTLSPAFAIGDDGVHGVGGEQRDGDDGDGYDCCDGNASVRDKAERCTLTTRRWDEQSWRLVVGSETT